MSPDFESRVRETGSRLFELIEQETPGIFKKEFWTGKMIDLCMKDEAFKVQMFRFIDVFPSLILPASVAKHLNQYFHGSEHNFLKALQWGIRLVGSESIASEMVARSIGKNIETMARQFIAGAAPQDALPEWKRLRGKKMALTVSLLGEAVVSEQEAAAYVQRNTDLLTVLDQAQHAWPPFGGGTVDLDWGQTPRVNISIKPSSLYSQMNARAFDYAISKAREMLRPILRKGVAVGAHVCIDMEQYSLKDVALRLFQRTLEEKEFAGYPHFGIAVQAYLRDSEADLSNLLQWGRRKGQRFSVRLVKGAYWDAEVMWAQQKNWPCPVFGTKEETDANFEKLAGLILKNHSWVRLACASHNVRSIACVIESARKLGLPPEGMEFQILYGMAEPISKALKKTGYSVRLYTPVGKMIPGMGYLVRRLLENTSNESFLRRSFRENVSMEELLKSPLKLSSEKQAATGVMEKAPAYGEKCSFRNEPFLDWAVSANRSLFEKTLKKVRKAFPYEAPLSINGEKTTTEDEIRSTNPAGPSEVVGIASSAGQEEVQQAVGSAKDAFPKWRDTSPEERAELLFRAAAVAREMRFELAALQVYEVGKTGSEADADVCEAIDFLEYYSREMIRLGRGRSIGKVPGETNHLFYEPRGVVAVIAPWNFPFAISVGMSCAALVTGNTVVYKPSSQSCITGSMVLKIFEKAGAPRGAFQFLPGKGGKIGDLLVTHPDVAMIAFTGSRKVGLRIIELAGRTTPGCTVVKNVVVDMGGKNAIIVDADADLDEAVIHIIQSAFGYQGQKCSACSRVIVLEENCDRLMERLKAAVESLEVGPPENPKNSLGPVIEASAKERILRFIETGKKEGRCLLERDVPFARGHFVPLTIFSHIRSHHQIAQEEIFGPLLAIIKVRDFDEALAVANDTQYALTGGVFSRSPENIERARREFRVGNLYINRGCTGALVERHPFGGFKLSGIGSKSGGPDYLLQFMVPRHISENTFRRGFAPLEDG